jgi:hypothetical protein
MCRSPGTYSTGTTTSTLCAYCNPNTYSDVYGATSCTPCPAGTTFNGYGATSVTQCT